MYGLALKSAFPHYPWKRCVDVPLKLCKAALAAAVWRNPLRQLDPYFYHITALRSSCRPDLASQPEFLNQEHIIVLHPLAGSLFATAVLCSPRLSGAHALALCGQTPRTWRSCLGDGM